MKTAKNAARATDEIMFGDPGTLVLLDAETNMDASLGTESSTSDIKDLLRKDRTSLITKENLILGNDCSGTLR